VRVCHRSAASRLGIFVAIVVGALGARSQASTLDAQQSTGAVSGAIADDTGTPIAGAKVTLTTAGGTRRDAATGANGRFTFIDVPAGPFRLTASAHGFAEQTTSASVTAGEAAELPEIRLRLAANAVAIDVTPSVVEIADRQIKEQEQQRVFGVVPNYYLSFNPDAAPLNARQKFRLSWKTRTDPLQFGFVAIVAGVQQVRNDYGGFGDGASGYAKRYAAAYATAWTGTMVTRVLMPTVFRQDPRYFYKGTGATGSRLVYAMSRSVIRKGDNRRWQPNYSGILGSVTSAAISNFYYPEEDRRGARLMLTNTAIGIAGSAVGHVAQEFLYARFTSRGHRKP
jgi:carboxypeptidase family protein